MKLETTQIFQIDQLNGTIIGFYLDQTHISIGSEIKTLDGRRYIVKYVSYPRPINSKVRLTGMALVDGFISPDTELYIADQR
ncbi:hypothetical protein HAU32_10685 [Weissella confusa]|uniref:Uncharacterized protein n=1 Tax=Weissella fermenti TaxID=2987699 RepID=A0ABT6D6Y1_9LACO|nr:MULTISPECIES: hypothetical protein [Weissella]MBJ7689409.1 hypothetical protein [Weissella confusa]MCW0927844.1 hypothetical protein [Weissella sp. LMG 11983]MDF9300856.1 hypothetical protein [Weissella sp. BK2]